VDGLSSLGVLTPLGVLGARCYPAHWLRNPSSISIRPPSPDQPLRSSHRAPPKPIIISVRPPPAGFQSPSEYHRACLPDLTAQAWPLSWGSFPFGAYDRPEPTNPGLASPGTLRLQAFTASWRLASPDASRPYFMPVTPLGFALQSFFPSSSRIPLGTALPSCRSPSRFGSASGP
jgi:hypothetical protein